MIAGTATVVAGGVNHHQQQKYAQRTRQQQAAPHGGRPAPRRAAPDSDDLINKLKELANLKDQGILTRPNSGTRRRRSWLRWPSPRNVAGPTDGLRETAP